MVAILAFLLLLLISISVALGVYGIRQHRLLNHYRDIRDLEQHQAECERKCRDSQATEQTLKQNAAHLLHEIAQHRAKVVQYQKLLGKFKTAEELNRYIRDGNDRARQIAAGLERLEHSSQLEAFIARQESEIQRQKAELDEVARAIGNARGVAEIAAQSQYYNNLLAQLKKDVEAVEETGVLQDFGFYRPRFNFDTSEKYQARLMATRDQQKWMLKAKTACTCATEWCVDGDRREGQRMVDQQIKLMLRAFNGECDAAVATVKYNNVRALENRIRRSFDAIAKLGEAKRVVLSEEYLTLKIDELHLSHEYQEQKHEEREEQRRIRDLMREEAKVQKEIGLARKKAERDERIKSEALAKARAELASDAGAQTAKLESLVARLESELQAAIDRKAKAIARAQLTRSGHVYILSNLGTFGENVYKIGLTRRLDPLERVRELGGAAVPFPFDVHAVIYCEDAPRLENLLHRQFASRRVNLVNQRREFFRVTLDEIRAAVADQFGHVSFITVAEAEQYRKTLALRDESKKSTIEMQIA